MIDRDWMLHAECRNYSPEIFFPDPHDRRAQAFAKSVCLDCPVVEQCDTYARKTDPSHGIWAGEFRNERNFRSVASAGLKQCGTSAAYQRHRRRGEQPCEACKRAEALMHAESRARNGRA
jgi:WhiB family redox-sensing transcriptional regulator